MNDKQILNAMDKAVLRLCVVGQRAARAQKDVLKAFRKGFLSLPRGVMESKVREHCEVLVNHDEPAVSDLYPGFQRSLRYAAGAAGLEISFSKKKNPHGEGKIVTVSLAVTAKDEQPKDEQPKDEQPKDEQPKDEQPKDEQPKDEQPNVTVLPEQPAPKQQTVSGTSSNGSKGSDVVQTTDSVDPKEVNSHNLLLKALDMILITEDQISAEQLFEVVATHYPRLALKQRYAFASAFDALVSKTEKAYQGAGRTGTNG